MRIFNPRYCVRFAPFAAALIALIFAAVPTAHAQEKDEEPDFESKWPEPEHKLISFWNIGPNLKPDEWTEFRPPHYMVGVKSWKEFIEKHIEPEYKWGCRRWILHNPFGDYTGPMHFDQAVLARKFGFDYLLDDFVEAWTGFKKRHPDVQVIAYLGKLRGNKQFAPLAPEKPGSLEPRDPSQWIERMYKSVELPLKAGMDIGMDASGNAVKGSPTHAVMVLLRSLGVKVYAEAIPPKGQDHMKPFGVVTAWRFYDRKGRWDRSIRPEKFKGEFVILANGNLGSNRALDKDPEALKKMIEKIQNLGLTPAVPVRVLLGKDAKS
jgi:hypothetical protein